MFAFRAVAGRALLLALAFAAASVAQGQSFPDRPVKIVVPFAAGGSSDGVSRIIARKLSAALGQPFVVENRPGAGGNIGADLVAKSRPDGYTLLFASGSFAVNVSLYSKLPFDVLRDFDPVIHVCTVNLMLVAHPSVGVKSVAQLIELARSKPGTVTYASPGSGTVGHLAGEMLRSTAKVDMTHVPYKGSGPSMTDLLGGQVNVMFANMPIVLQHVKSGKLTALAVASEKRTSLMPELPTIAESGLGGFQATTWFGVLAPAGTPPAIIKLLNAEIGKALAAPDLQEHLRADGAEPTGGSPEQFRAFLRAEIDRWAPVVKSSGAKAD